jgi:ferredoxin
MPVVKILEGNLELDIPSGETILQGSMIRGLTFGFVCGGNAACGTCLVKVLEGLESLSPRNQKEDFLAKAMMLDPDYRLGCQTEIGQAPLVISILSLARGKGA